jgi:FkbM family methyltransferase
LALAKIFIFPRGMQTLFDPNSIRHHSILNDKKSFKKIKIANDMRLTVDLNDIIGFRTALNKKWDSTSLNLVSKIYKGDLIFIDVGANIGSTCLPIAKLNILTIAIEANLKTAQLLLKNILENDINQIIVLPFAVGAYKQGGKFMDLSVSIGNISSASLVKGWSHGKKPVELQKVYVTTLDQVMGSLGFMKPKRNIVIKIDVEGFEQEVLKGSKQIIKTHRPIIIFENNPNGQNKGATFARNFNKLFINYKVYQLTESTQLLKFNANKRYENAVLIPNEKLSLFNIDI